MTNVMPVLLFLFAILCFVIMFFVLRRPIYEVVLVTFLIITVVSGNLRNIGGYLYAVLTNYMLYVILGFIAFSIIAERTGVVKNFVNTTLSLVGKLPGGAGYVSLVAATAMGALSGSSPGNAAAVGTITIPLMKRTGFSSEFAASAQTSFSSLGTVIPPSGAFVAAYGILQAMNPDACTMSQFWLITWGIVIWLILQRIITLFFFVKRNHIEPVSPDKLMPIGEALKKGWLSLLMPVVIIVPILLDALLNSTLITARLGAAGAKTFTTCMLVITPSFACLYAVAASKQFQETDNLKKRILNLYKEDIGALVPVVILVFAGFALAEVFDDIGLGAAFSSFFLRLHASRLAVAVFIPLFLTFLGLFLEPLSVMLMLGAGLITLGETVGISPILMAAMLTTMIQATAGQTPPFASTLFVTLGISDADFVKTTKWVVIWVALQYVVIVLILLGALPILGIGSFAV